MVNLDLTRLNVIMPQLSPLKAVGYINLTSLVS